MIAMTKIEEQIVAILIRNNILTSTVVPEIKDKMDIGLTLGEVLVGDNYLSQDDFCSILVELYKRRQIAFDDISENFRWIRRNFCKF